MGVYLRIATQLQVLRFATNLQVLQIKALPVRFS